VSDSDYKGFPGRDWRSATRGNLIKPVADLREVFRDRAGFSFRKIQREVREFVAPANGDDRLLLLPDLFQGAYLRLQDVLMSDSQPSFESFLRIAQSQKSVDPVSWAHAQTHAMVGDFLDPPTAYKKFSRLRSWIQEHCSGQWRPTLDELEDGEALVSSLLGNNWRAPDWLQHLVGNGRPMETEKVLDVLVSQFWRKIEHRLANMARSAQIFLAENGGPPVCKRRKPNPLSKFDELAGRLTYEASETGATLPEKLSEICQQLDEAGFGPVINHLRPRDRKRLAYLNQKRARSAIKTFSEAAGYSLGGDGGPRRWVLVILYGARKKWREAHTPVPASTSVGE
jgi:hypothetical protein